MEFSKHAVDFFYKNNNCCTTKSCNFYIKTNLMKNGSKFEAQYQPHLATESILSNLWKWQAGRVGSISKTHFSNSPTVPVIGALNKGQNLRFFLNSQATLEVRLEKGRKGQAPDSLFTVEKHKNKDREEEIKTNTWGHKERENDDCFEAICILLADLSERKNTKTLPHSLHFFLKGRLNRTKNLLEQEIC